MFLALEKFIMFWNEILAMASENFYLSSLPNGNNQSQETNKINELNGLTYEKRLEELNLYIYLSIYIYISVSISI